MKKNKTVLSLFLFLWLAFPLFGQTIKEKKAALSHYSNDLSPKDEEILSDVNRIIEEKQYHIRNLYAEALSLYQSQAGKEEYESLLEEVQETKKNLQDLQVSWRKNSLKEEEESYGLWHQPDTNLEQLVIDYGSNDYVYLIPEEIASMKVSIDSQLAVPRSSWEEMLKMVLEQNGVGIRQLNPYLRELYLYRDKIGSIEMITKQKKDLLLYPPETRVGFLISPEPSEVHRSFQFLEKFLNEKNMGLHLLGRDILIFARVGDVLDLLKVYEFVDMTRGDKEYKLVTLSKIPSQEMEKILSCAFDQETEGQNGNTTSLGFRIIRLEGLSQALFLMGTKEEIKKASEMIAKVENQLNGGREKTIYRYIVKHSDPVELADVLAKVYTLMKSHGVEGFVDGECCKENQITQANISIPKENLLPQELYEDNYYQEGNFVVNPTPVEPGRPIKRQDPNQGRENFIVDPKSGSIVMVVEADILPKIKDLLKKIDIPKKMVQIEVMLFEKRVSKENNFGLNLLRIGSNASNTCQEGVRFNDCQGKKFKETDGVFQYFLSYAKNSCIPAFDFSYKFLLSQDDIHINSAPSVLTLNQTPARIDIIEEISLNTGVFEVETAKGVTLKDSFTRSQYGIIIELTPTIHMDEENLEEGGSYITLDTNVTFDTILPGGNPERPDVARRHIVNQVRIPDGQTVILGGLKRKTSNDNKESIPFLGELPGIGKLFGTTSLKDNTTEMFLFITPKIVAEPKDELLRIRKEQLCRRPGDLPYFVACLNEARKCEKEKCMEGTLTALFGRGADRYYHQEGEYDGR